METDSLTSSLSHMPTKIGNSKQTSAEACQSPESIKNSSRASWSSGSNNHLQMQFQSHFLGLSMELDAQANKTGQTHERQTYSTAAETCCCTVKIVEEKSASISFPFSYRLMVIYGKSLEFPYNA